MSCELQQAEIQTVLDGSGWVVRPVRTLHEAEAALARWSGPLVLCEPRFSGGDWRGLLASLHTRENAPKLVMVARHDTALAAELINLGGYDVLETPLDAAECLHVVDSARRQWKGPAHHTGCVLQSGFLRSAVPALRERGAAELRGASRQMESDRSVATQLHRLASRIARAAAPVPHGREAWGPRPHAASPPL